MSFTWTKGTAVTGSGIYLKCIWAGGSINKFVAVGGRTGVTKRIATSPDGITWTAQTVGQNNNWSGIAFDGTTLVVVSVNGVNRVMTSTDAVNWTVRTASEANAWADVCWSPSVTALGSVGQFVAVAETGTHRVMTSPDGIAWTNQTAASLLAWAAIDWSPTLQLYVSTAQSASTSNIMTSPDAVTWTPRTNPLGAIVMAQCGVVWGTGAARFVAGVDTTSNHVISSSDGVTWTDWSGIPSGWGTHPVSRVAWSPELLLFMAVSNDTVNTVLTSPDGQTWTTEVMSDGVTNFVKAWGCPGYSPSLHAFVIMLNADSADITALGVGATQSLSPTSSRDTGDVTVTIKGSGINGGFTNQPGGNYAVVFYPFAGLGLSAPDFLTNYFLGGAYAFGAQASNVTWVDSTTLTCTPPRGCGNGAQYGLAAGPIAVDVAVFDREKAGANCLFYMGGSFTYVDPVMLSISPASGTVLGGEVITITGTNFYDNQGLFNLGGNLLQFGQAPAFCTYVNQTTLTCVAPSFFGGTDPIVDVTFVPSHLSNQRSDTQFATFAPASTTLLNAYTYIAVWWVFDPTRGFDFEFFDLVWDDLDFGFGIGTLGSDQFVWYFYGLESPSGRTRGWVVFGGGSTPPNPNGWWMSIEGFTGSVMVVVDSRPKNPRSWADFQAFAAGTAAMLGGSPGYGCVLENKLVYAASGYTTFPPIRIFDGSFDRELCTLPPTSAGATPYAIVSMLAANGTIYVSTLDTGTDSTNWVGRVFSLDIATAALTPVGAAFTTGHVPYALAWHNGRLYCGTHRQVSTAVGKIYTILPGVDTVWTEDYDLGTLSMTGVGSMLSFQGTLFVGCTAAAGTFAKVIKRATDGTYSTAETGSGGTARANNGFLSLAEFGGAIYAGYWNNDTTAVTSIRTSSDGTTWAVSFTGSTTTLRPIIALFVDSGVLYAIGGGLSLTAAILSTVNGVAWTNLTANLPDTGETALPVFGVVVF